MSSCPHISQLKSVQPPKLSQSVHREECTQCFDNQDQPSGIDVCLTCFNGGCLDPERSHMRTHISKTSHPFTLNIKRKAKPSSKRAEDEEPPAKMTKIAIVEEKESEKYEHKTAIKCWLCDPVNGLELPDVEHKALVDGVMNSLSSARQSEVKSWEEEFTACEHTLMLEQFQTGHIAESGLAHCTKCDLKENLWLCLTCGSLGCGRKQFGGVGGNGHGLQHYEETRHPVSVKLGTITPEGGADIYCYACNDAKLDLELATHLATFGINVQTQKKTEKSMTELQIEHNLKFDFSLTGEDGKALEPVFGPGLTGLANLGNSCYMASTLQTLFSLPSFQSRYFSASSGPENAMENHWATCQERLPADCLECQLYKIGDGLLSGRYSVPHGQASPSQIPSDPKLTSPLAHDSPIPVFQEGVKPSSFKSLIGKGHEEFSTMRQQDSEEFFGHLVESIRRYIKREGPASGNDPTEVFKFGLEQRLQCTECRQVRYRVEKMDVLSLSVPKRELMDVDKDDKGKEEGKKYEEVELKECLDGLVRDEALEYKCPQCKKDVLAIKQTKFATYPDVLVIHAKKFQLVNWVPSKLDIPVNLPPNDLFELDSYLGYGLQKGEALLPDDDDKGSQLPEFNQEALAQLEGMGFPHIRCQKALLATGNQDSSAAMEWIFAHMDDADIDAPLQVAGSSGSGPEPSEDSISTLSAMGFTHAQARKALRETGGDPARAVDWLFSHPDDTGEEPAQANEATASASEPVVENPGGSATLPARFKLKAFISHKGPSVHSGHYVAHIRHDGNQQHVDDGWVLFNDEKVVKADRESVNELKKLAYVYVFERI